MPGADDPRDFPFHILEKAEQLCARGFNEAALVTAQSACELGCERAIEKWLASRGAGYLHECLHEMVPSFNVCAGKTRDLYTTLTDDHIQQQPFWHAYTELTQLRNRIVHRGEQVHADTARKYLDVARGVVEHLERTRAAAASLLEPARTADRLQPSAFSAAMPAGAPG